MAVLFSLFTEMPLSDLMYQMSTAWIGLKIEHLLLRKFDFLNAREIYMELISHVD